MTTPSDKRQPSATAAAALWGNRNFVLFMGLRLLNILGVHMLTVAVGWHIYQQTHNPLDLGLVGLSQFAPALAIFLIAGVAADRFDRRALLVICNAAHTAVAVALLVLALQGVDVVWPTFALLVAHGVARAFFLPASQAILPNLVEPHLFPNAVAYASLAMKLGTLVGPALGGFLIALADDTVYLVNAGVFLAAAAAASLISRPLTIRSIVRPGLSTILGGLGYIRKKKLVLGAITIDLVAVLFGGVVGLMPVFASDILHVGPEGLGVMRAMPAYQRAAILERAAKLMSERVEDLARTISSEEGKILAESRVEAKRAAEVIALSAEEAKRLTGEMIPLDSVENGVGKFGFTLRVPCGIVAAITPFNFPLNLVTHKVGPAIAGGNAVIVKPASDTPLSASPPASR